MGFRIALDASGVQSKVGKWAILSSFTLAAVLDELTSSSSGFEINDGDDEGGEGGMDGFLTEEALVAVLDVVYWAARLYRYHCIWFKIYLRYYRLLFFVKESAPSVRGRVASSRNQGPEGSLRSHLSRSIVRERC